MDVARILQREQGIEGIEIKAIAGMEKLLKAHDVWLLVGQEIQNLIAYFGVVLPVVKFEQPNIIGEYLKRLVSRNRSAASSKLNGAKHGVTQEQDGQQRQPELPALAKGPIHQKKTVGQ
mgnify:CR=1 FL=1